MTFKQGLFNRDTLEVTFGGPLSVDKNRFVAQAVKVPDFTYTHRGREDAGGGCYYNNWVTTEITEKNTYLILKDGKVIGWMMPCHYYWQTQKSSLYPMDWKGTKSQVKQFAESLQAINQ